MNVVIKETTELASSPCEETTHGRVSLLQPGRGVQPEPDHAGTTVWDFELSAP